MDVRIVIQRSAVYSILVGSASVLFFSLLIGFELVLHRRPDGPSLAAAGSALALTVAVFEPFERRLRAITDRLFFKQRYEYSHVVQILSETLNATLAIEQLVPRVVRKLKYLFRTRSACVYSLKAASSIGSEPISVMTRTAGSLCAYSMCVRTSSSALICRSSSPTGNFPKT
jgi:hypothetical protein